MAILVRLVFTALAGVFTVVTKKVPWMAVVGTVGTIAGVILTVLQIIKELKALGWIS